MSILGTKMKSNIMQVKKMIWVYLVLSGLAFATDKIYALFGHGVTSKAMSWMFLYPLIGGVLLFTAIDRLIPEIAGSDGFRLFYNVYNSGIAILTIGGFFRGILDIAGTSSGFSAGFLIAGWGTAGAGLVLLLRLSVRHSSQCSDAALKTAGQK